MRHLKALIAVYLLFSVARATQCSVGLNKLLFQKSSYVWTCDCKDKSGVEIVRARVEVPDTFGNKDTPKTRAILRCAVDLEDRVSSACRKSASAFRKTASHALRRCLQAKPKPVDGDSVGEISADESETCQAKYASYVGERIEGVWVCECPFPNIEYVFGRAGFETSAAPAGAAEEVQKLQECTNSAQKQLSDVCKKTPGDFTLLALQQLEACCKRARVDSQAKFQCKAAVPEDVNGLKFFREVSEAGVSSQAMSFLERD